MKKLLFVLPIVVLLAAGCGANPTQAPKAQTQTQHHNQPTNQSNIEQIDPKVQALIDQYNNLGKNLSDDAKNGKPNDQDSKIETQLNQIRSELSKYDKSDINALLQIQSYGYEIKMQINGHDINSNSNFFISNSSSSVHLFDSNGIMAKLEDPFLPINIFILNKGANTIKIDYKKTGKFENFDLIVDITAYNKDKVLEITAKNKQQGTIEQTFNLDTIKPNNFQTITVNE